MVILTLAHDRTYLSWGQPSNLSEPVGQLDNDRNDEVSDEIVVLCRTGWVINPKARESLELVRTIGNSLEILRIDDRR